MTRDADIARIAAVLNSLDDEHITSHRLGIAAALYDAGLRPSAEPGETTEHVEIGGGYCTGCGGAHIEPQIAPRGDPESPFYIHRDCYDDTGQPMSRERVDPSSRTPAVLALLAATPSAEPPDLSCPKCGVNSHDNDGDGWTHACDQRFLAALESLPERFTVVRPSAEPQEKRTTCGECGHATHRGSCGDCSEGPCRRATRADYDVAADYDRP